MDTKQDELTARNNLTITNGVLDVDENIVTNSLVIRPSILKANYTPATNGEIRATTLTIDDYLNGVVYDVKDTLNQIQDKLIAGDNITIDASTNVISSTGGTTIDSTTDLSCNTLTTTGDATIGGTLTIGSETLDTKINNSINGKQNTITARNNLTITNDVLDVDENVVTNSLVIRPSVLKANYTPATNGEIRATTLTIDDYLNGVVYDVKDTLNQKQNKLLEGENITITRGEKSDTISSTGGITQAQLDTKQDKLDVDDELNISSIRVDNNFNVDDKIVHEDQSFNTIVVRRADQSDLNFIDLVELQCWVNNANLIVDNSGILNGYFANWQDNSVELPPVSDFYGVNDVSNSYNNIFETTTSESRAIGNGIVDGLTNAMIIKNVPLTLINDVQAIVFYTFPTTNTRAEGLVIELYNTNNDPNLKRTLAKTEVINTIVSNYRFDFPSISNYTLGFDTTGRSTSQIISTDVSSTIQEVVDTSVILLNTFTNIEDDLKVSGVLYSDNATMLNMSASQITSQDVITENTTSKSATIDNATIYGLSTNSIGTSNEGSGTVFMPFVYGSEKLVALKDFEARGNATFDGVITISGETLDSKLNGKQDKLENTSNLDIKSLNVLSDFGAIIVETAGQIACDILSSGTLSTNGDASIGGKLTAPSGNIETFTAYTLNAFSCTLDTFNAQFINLVGNLNMTGTLTIGGETLDSKLNGKQDTLTAGSGITIDASTNVISSTGGGGTTIDSTTDLSCNTLTTTGDVSIGGIITAPNQPCFKLKCNNTTISGINSNLNYNGVVIDNYSAYDINAREYVIPVAGNWFFYYGFQSNDVPFQVQLQQNDTLRDECQITNMNPVLSDPAVGPLTFNSVAAKGHVILPCVVGDIIRIRVTSGSVRIGSVAEFSSFGGFMIG